MKKTITLEIPDGKKAEWINNILTLVDEEDNRPITERIKTFDDARNELNRRAENGDEVAGKILCDYEGHNLSLPESIAYLKLCIIVAALNEGWEPKFTTDEYRYFPWFELFTKEELDKMTAEKRSRVVLRSNSSAYANGGVACAHAYVDSSSANTCFGSRLAFKSRDLAVYAGKTFTREYADFVFPERQNPLGNESGEDA